MPVANCKLAKAIALEARLAKCVGITTLGVRPNWLDYPECQRKMILAAGKVYYPSNFYAGLFETLGVRIFPSIHNYRYAQDKIAQTALFQISGIAHPKTRVFYGKRQQQSILEHFDLPLVAKTPRGSAMGRGVFLIRNQAQLRRYCRQHHAAYIQQYFPVDRDLRIVIIGEKAVLAYWRISGFGEFRSNVARGAAISFENIPSDAIKFALHVARTCKWNDVGVDICCFKGVFYVLEANMKYGRRGFVQAGIDYYRLMEGLIADGSI